MATPIRKTDNIMSSEAAERGIKGFIPSYEKVRKQLSRNSARENIFFL